MGTRPPAGGTLAFRTWMAGTSPAMTVGEVRRAGLWILRPRPYVPRVRLYLPHARPGRGRRIPLIPLDPGESCKANVRPSGTGRPYRRRKDGGCGLVQAEVAEALVEARDLAAAVDDALGAAGPHRVRQRVDIEGERVARLAPRGARGKGAAVGPDDGDLVIVGMNVFLHGGPRLPSGFHIAEGRKAQAAMCLGSSPTSPCPPPPKGRRGDVGGDGFTRFSNPKRRRGGRGGAGCSPSLPPQGAERAGVRWGRRGGIRSTAPAQAAIGLAATRISSRHQHGERQR